MTQIEEIRSEIKHALVVYFPGSGRAGDLTRNLGQIVRRLTEEGGYCVSTMVLTDAPALEQMVADTKADIIVGVGGDGTIRRVLEAVVLSGTRVPVGIIPLGTGNLFAKSIGVLPAGKINKVETAMDVILMGQTAYIDLGKANDRIFAIDVGLGPISTAVMAPKPGHKSRLKMFAYTRPFFQAIRKKPVKFEIELDGRREIVEASGIFVTNERDMGLTTGPGDLTQLRNGRMYLYIVNPRTFMDWMRIAWGVSLAYFASNPFENAPYRRSIVRHRVRINAEKPCGYMMDGDRCSVTPVEVEVLPSAVTLFVPNWARKHVYEPPVRAGTAERA